MYVSLIVVVVVLTALIFDFTNGFHDTANAMATSIATGALRPRVAVAIAGCLNLVGAFLSVQVAKTISGGLVDETLINPVVIFAGLVGAILWNLMTWYLGLPSSSSHALFGGLIGATWVAGGVDAIHFNAVLNKVVAPGGGLAAPRRRDRPGCDLPGLPRDQAGSARRRLAGVSGWARRSPRRWSRSPTAPTTRRRPWA